MPRRVSESPADVSSRPPISGMPDSTIRVVARHVDEGRLPSVATSASTFWAPFIAAFRENNRPSERFLERRLERRLPEALRNRLPIAEIRRFVDAGLSRLDELDARRAQAADELIILVEVVSYGSLHFEITFGTIERLAAVFENNFDLFRLFLDAYLPVAFVESLIEPGETRADTVERVESELAFEYSVPSAMVERFTQARFHEGPTLRSRARAAVDKTRWAWLVTNSTLLVPAFLALTILYVAFQRVSSYQDAQDARAQELFRLQHDALVAERSHSQKLLDLLMLKPPQETNLSRTPPLGASSGVAP